MNDLQKWRYLRDIPQADRWHQEIISIAKGLWKAASCCDGLHTAQRRYAMLAQTVARDWIHQVSDTTRTGGEDIAGLTRFPTVDDAVDALTRGSDDCDAKSRLFVALCLANGMQARVVPYWKRLDNTTSHERGTPPVGSVLYHVAAEVWVDNAWQPVELTLSRARFGELGKNVPVEKDGKWKDA